MIGIISILPRQLPFSTAMSFDVMMHTLFCPLPLSREFCLMLDNQLLQTLIEFSSVANKTGLVFCLSDEFLVVIK